MGKTTNRRHVLVGVAVAASAAIGGCLGDSDDDAAATPGSGQADTEVRDQRTPARFEIVDLRPGDTEVEYGEEIEVELVIENVGEEAGSVEVAAVLDGTVVGASTHTIAGGDQHRITDTVETLDLPAGDSEYGYRIDGDEVLATLTVTLEEPDPITFIGTGSDVTDRFDVEGGMVIVEWRHLGERDFMLELVDPDGVEDEPLLADDWGRVRGVWGQGVSEGEYVLEIAADGSWHIDIHQPRVTRQGGQSVPFATSGDASGDWFVVRTDGRTRVAATHDGSGTFTVRSYEIDGSSHRDSLLFDEIGEFSGSTTYAYEAATFIVVEADGRWSLEFEEA